MAASSRHWDAGRRGDLLTNRGGSPSKSRPRSKLAGLGAIVWLAGCGSPAIAETPVAAPPIFEQYEISTGSSNLQTVLTGFLLGGTVADLAIVEIDEATGPQCRIYSLSDSTWAPKSDARLRPEVLFVDVARIAGRDRLITYEPGRLDWFDPETATQRPLVVATSSFDPPRKDQIAHVDLTRDLNNDGRDDLVVPAAEGFLVFVQADDGSFAHPVRVGPTVDLSGVYGADGYRYDPWSRSRVHLADFDGDGRNDLVWWNGNHFDVHTQDEHGLFLSVPETSTTDVAFDSDDVFSLATGEMTGRVLHSLADLNGDGVADLVVLSLQGSRDSEKRSVYEVHHGTSMADGGTRFSRGVGHAFDSNGSVWLGMERHDFDGDGRMDVMLMGIDVKHLQGSLWKRIKGFMGDDIRLDLSFYRQRDGGFSDTPDAIRTIALDGVPSPREPGSVSLDIVLRGARHERRRSQKIWPRAFNSTLLIGDVTGDGRADLVIGQHPRQLEVFVGVPGPDLFSVQPHNVVVAVPNDEEYTWLVDLDRDGKQDILMHQTFGFRDAHGAPTRPSGTEPHRVTVLLAR